MKVRTWIQLVLARLLVVGILGSDLDRIPFYYYYGLQGLTLLFSLFCVSIFAAYDIFEYNFFLN